METTWTQLLQDAVTKPGLISEAYSMFHGYSIGNQLLAMVQCCARGIAPGPIGTFMHWKAAGRNVRKGEKAIMLCMPITGKRTATNEAGEDTEIGYTRFTYRNNWFVLSQTDGAAYDAPVVPDWDQVTALSGLDITRVEFEHANGNVQGYASKRTIAVSPLAAMPHKTMFHELAHVVLGHTAESDMNDSDITPRNIRELEAESVAMICCESLGLPGSDYSRGYIQSWYQGSEVPERSAQRIFSAADKILKAGRK